MIYVPHGNSVEKNAAMRAFGAELVEFGEDFDTAQEEAIRVAEAEGLHPVPPFHRELVRGVATYALELFTAQARPRHRLCADRLRLGHLRGDRGARRAGAEDQGGRRRLDRGA